MTGLDNFNSLSSHPLAARKVGTVRANRIEIKLSPRQVDLRSFAARNELGYYPQKQRNAVKYKDFPIQKGNKILYEENVITWYTDLAKLEVSDMTLTEGARQMQEDTHITVLHASDLDIQLPDFALEPEGLWSRVSELVGGKDIDFAEYPEFSDKYYLRGVNETAVREFFGGSLVQFFESRGEMHVECHKNRLLIYKKRDLLGVRDIEEVEKFSEDLIEVIYQNQKTAQAV